MPTSPETLEALEEIRAILEEADWVDQMSSLISTFMSNDKWYQDTIVKSYEHLFKENAASYAEKRKVLIRDIEDHKKNNARYKTRISEHEENEEPEEDIDELRMHLTRSNRTLEDLIGQNDSFTTMSTQGTDFKILYNCNHYAGATSNRNLVGIYAKNAMEFYFDQKDEDINPITSKLANTYELINHPAQYAQKIVEGFKRPVTLEDRNNMHARLGNVDSITFIEPEEQDTFLEMYIPAVKEAVAKIQQLSGMMDLVIWNSEDKTSSRPDKQLADLAKHALEQVKQIEALITKAELAANENPSSRKSSIASIASTLGAYLWRTPSPSDSPAVPPVKGLMNLGYISPRLAFTARAGSRSSSLGLNIKTHRRTRSSDPKIDNKIQSGTGTPQNNTPTDTPKKNNTPTGTPKKHTPRLS